MNNSFLVKTDHIDILSASQNKNLAEWETDHIFVDLDVFANEVKDVLIKSCDLMKATGRMDLVRLISSGVIINTDAKLSGKLTNNMWSIPMDYNAKYIKGDVYSLPVWIRELISKCAIKEDTKTIVIYYEYEYSIVKVFVENYSAELVGEYCDIYTTIIESYSDISFDFRVTASKPVDMNEYPEKVVIVGF